MTRNTQRINAGRGRVTRTKAAAVCAALVVLGAPTVVSRSAFAANSQSESRTTYVVLAKDAQNVDSAIATVTAAGGRVERVNRAIGLVTASSNEKTFTSEVSANGAIAGVARDKVVGVAPRNGENRREGVEKEGRETAAGARSKAAAQSADQRRKSEDKKEKDRDKDKQPEPLANIQWDMAMIGATPNGSYEENRGRKDVLVGIIDTGIDGTHPDIAPNFDAALSRNFTVDIPVIDGDCALEADQSCNDANNVDEDGHGTHVAGTIGSPINKVGMAGVAPNVTLVNLRAGQDSGYFFLGPTVDALTYAGDNGIDVVNMSFFIDPWLYNCRANPADSAAEQSEQATIIDATQRALNYARARGVTLIAALGNEHTDLGLALKTDDTSPDFPPDSAKVREVTNDCVDMPTEADGVIAVSSVGPSQKKADYSNHGLEQNDIAAPGGFFRDFIGTPQFRQPENMILGPYPTNVAVERQDVDPVTGESLSPFVIADCSGTTISTCAYWQLIQGTSMAAPHAAGVAALIVSKHGDGEGKQRTLSPAKVEKILYKTATEVGCPSPVISYIAEGRSPEYDAPCVGTKSWNSIYGHGIVNALRAVK